jgi:hypothetical protein
VFARCHLDWTLAGLLALACDARAVAGGFPRARISMISAMRRLSSRVAICMRLALLSLAMRSNTPLVAIVYMRVFSIFAKILRAYPWSITSRQDLPGLSATRIYSGGYAAFGTNLGEGETVITPTGQWVEETVIV